MTIVEACKQLKNPNQYLIHPAYHFPISIREDGVLVIAPGKDGREVPAPLTVKALSSNTWAIQDPLV